MLARGSLEQLAEAARSVSQRQKLQHSER